MTKYDHKNQGIIAMNIKLNFWEPTMNDVTH